MKKLLPILIILVIAVSFFKPFFLQKLVPIPTDTIVGLYYPFRDLYAQAYPRGIPFKNFLITDPVRQQYPWRNVAIGIEKKFQLPLWNPYSFSGTPLLGNGQSAPFYPLNFLFFIMPFSIAWTILIILEPLLAGIFTYLYLKNLKLHPFASILGAITYSFSGFFVAWLEWGTILHVALWMPLILLSIDKCTLCLGNKEISNKIFKIQKYKIWALVYLFAFTCAFLAGHLQTFFYVLLISMAYLCMQLLLAKNKRTIFIVFLLFTSCFLLLTAIQWIPLFQFIFLSARNVDLNWRQEGWFIPWQNLIQFIIPDFFGNPATGNYWGVWNYGEFIGYIGIFPLITSFFALFFRRDKKTLFFGTLFFLSLLFAFPTIFAQVPFLLNIPFVSTAQPTRLLFITDFSLAVLAALGFDYFIKTKSREIFYPIGFFSLVFISIWIVMFTNTKLHILSPEHLSIAKRNLVLPSIIFLVSTILVIMKFLLSMPLFPLSLILSPRRGKNVTLLLTSCFLLLTIFDLFRFADKFETFASSQYLYPNTKVLTYLQQHAGLSRVMTTDDRILPPNFSDMYHLQSIDGYDPLYLLQYGELMSASERGKPDISPPFGFNRIITPHQYDSDIINLLGVKYVLSVSDLQSSHLQKVFQDGQTRIYENERAFPRAMFVPNVEVVTNKQEAVNKLFDKNFFPATTALVECNQCSNISYTVHKLGITPKITHYSENNIILEAENTEDMFLLLFDQYYPTWHATIDGKETKIYPTDYAFRGIVVPKGKHRIEFYDSLF